MALLLVLLCGRAAAVKPAARARAFASAQLATVRADDTAAMVATFAPDAVLLGLGHSGAPAAKAADLRDALMNGSPHSTFKKATIRSIVAGGDDSQVWFTAEIDTVYDNFEPEGMGSGPNSHQASRLTELIVKDGDTWKAVAGVIDRPTATSGYYTPAPVEVANPTAAGPLAPLLASPAALIERLASAPGSFVLGTDRRERGIGRPAARKLLGRWTKLGLQLGGAVREVQSSSYAFAQAGVSWTARSKYDKDRTLTYTMTALVIAVPDGDGWRVVAVHYASE